MKLRSLLVLSAVILSLLMFSTSAFSTPSASFMYEETDLKTGWWQYDYTINNTSDNGEYLYMFLLDFDQTVTAQGLAHPTAWLGVVWGGTNVTTFLDAMSINPATYISAGDSLGGFSFRTNTRVGDVSYHAEFVGVSSIDGTTTVVPEPLSMVLFLVGGVLMTVMYRAKRKRQITSVQNTMLAG
jgi:hypothetical protein